MVRFYCILLLGALWRINVFSTHESMKNDFKDLYWKCSMWIWTKGYIVGYVPDWLPPNREEVRTVPKPRKESHAFGKGEIHLEMFLAFLVTQELIISHWTSPCLACQRVTREAQWTFDQNPILLCSILEHPCVLSHPPLSGENNMLLMGICLQVEDTVYFSIHSTSGFIISCQEVNNGMLCFALAWVNGNRSIFSILEGVCIWRFFVIPLKHTSAGHFKEKQYTMKDKSSSHFTKSSQFAEGKVTQNMMEIISVGMIVILDILTWFLVLRVYKCISKQQ